LRWRDILGPDFAGVLTTNRYTGCVWLLATLRQLCWAHLDAG
jgi:transposase